MLSSDVATEFRGRGQIINVTPLSFAEFMPLRASERNPFKVIEEYLLYGGLPECALAPSGIEKESYLKNLYQTIYVRDFVVNSGPRQIYIQSAYSMPTAEKREQETFPLRQIRDSFKKVVITNDPLQPKTYDDCGIAYIGLLDFLLDPMSLETL